MIKKLYFMVCLCSSMLLVACGGGGGGSSEAGTAATSASATPVLAASVNSCFSIASPSTNIGQWWMSGSFNVTNTCATSQSAS